MAHSPRWLAGLLAFAFLLAILVPPGPRQALSDARSIQGDDIPLIDGAKIIKKKLHQTSGRFELEVDQSPVEAADFYRDAMMARGWPPGRILNLGNRCAFILAQDGNQFAFKAEVRNGRTHVTLTLVRKPPLPATVKTAPVSNTDKLASQAVGESHKPLAQDKGVTIGGAPPEKGAFVKQVEVSPPQGGGSPLQQKDPGPSSEDPEPPAETPDTETDDASSSGSANRGSPEIVSADKLPAGRLSVNVRVTACWEVTDPEDFTYEGLITLQFNGTLALNPSGSPVVTSASRLRQPLLTYTPEVMTLTYHCYEIKTSLKPIPDGFCPDPLVCEFQGRGVAPITDTNATGLKIQRSGASAAPILKNLSPEKQRVLAAMQGSMAIPDYYEFHVGGPDAEKRIQGRRKSNKEKCEYMDAEKSFTGGGVGIQMGLPATETLSALKGTRTWRADDQGLCPPTMGLHVSNVAPLLEKAPFKPAEGGNQNVTYTVSWLIQPTYENNGSFQADEQKKKKKPCDPVQNKILQLKVIRKLYENPNIRKYADENFPDGKDHNDRLRERKSRYQEAVENLFLDIMKSAQASDWYNFDSVATMIDTLTDAQISDAYRTISRNPGSGIATCMTAGGAWVTSDPCKFRDLGISMNIHGSKNVKIIEFVGEETAQSFNEVDTVKTGYFEAARATYMANYFDNQEVGLALFEAALAHEMTHVQQYVENCFPRSVDDMARYEVEAYSVEMDKLERYLDKWDC